MRKSYITLMLISALLCGCSSTTAILLEMQNRPGDRYITSDVLYVDESDRMFCRWPDFDPSEVAHLKAIPVGSELELMEFNHEYVDSGFINGGSDVYHVKMRVVADDDDKEYDASSFVNLHGNLFGVCRSSYMVLHGI